MRTLIIVGIMLFGLGVTSTLEKMQQDVHANELRGPSNARILDNTYRPHDFLGRTIGVIEDKKNGNLVYFMIRDDHGQLVVVPIKEDE